MSDLVIRLKWIKILLSTNRIYRGVNLKSANI